LELISQAMISPAPPLLVMLLLIPAQTSVQQHQDAMHGHMSTLKWDVKLQISAGSNLLQGPPTHKIVGSGVLFLVSLLLLLLPLPVPAVAPMTLLHTYASMATFALSQPPTGAMVLVILLLVTLAATMCCHHSVLVNVISNEIGHSRCD